LGLKVKTLKFFDADPGSGMETVRIRDPGWKKVGSGIGDKQFKHPGSAKLKISKMLSADVITSRSKSAFFRYKGGQLGFKRKF
jgi:hypothetical protein